MDADTPDGCLAALPADRPGAIPAVSEAKVRIPVGDYIRVYDESRSGG